MSRKPIDWSGFDKFKEDLINKLIMHHGIDVRISDARMRKFYSGDSGRREDSYYAFCSANDFFADEINDAWDEMKKGYPKLGRDGTWALIAKGLSKEYILVTGSADIRFFHHEYGIAIFNFGLDEYNDVGFYLWRGLVEEMDSPTAYSRGVCTIEKITGAVADRWIKKTKPKTKKAQ
jgi:hypothetical protein